MDASAVKRPKIAEPPSGSDPRFDFDKIHETYPLIVQSAALRVDLICGMFDTQLLLVSSVRSRAGNVSLHKDALRKRKV